MNFFNHLKIGARLTLAQGCVLLLMASVAACGLLGLNSLTSSAQRLLAQDVQLAQHAADIQILVLLERRFEKDSFINVDDPKKLASYTDRWRTAGAKLLKTVEAARSLELTPEDSQALD